MQLRMLRRCTTEHHAAYFRAREMWYHVQQVELHSLVRRRVSTGRCLIFVPSSLEFFDLALLALNTEVLAWLNPAHSVYLLFHNPRRAFVTAPPVVISSAAWAGDLTCTPIPDGGICEDAALFWSSCDHEPTSRSPIRRPRPSLCPGSTGVNNNGKARQGKASQLSDNGDYW